MVVVVGGPLWPHPEIYFLVYAVHHPIHHHQEEMILENKHMSVDHLMVTLGPEVGLVDAILLLVDIQVIFALNEAFLDLEVMVFVDNLTFVGSLHFVANHHFVVHRSIAVSNHIVGKVVLHQDQDLAAILQKDCEQKCILRIIDAPVKVSFYCLYVRCNFNSSLHLQFFIAVK